jgi:beta-glucosidase
MTDSSDLSQRALEETYAPQYEAVVRQGGAGAVMCSYNRIDSVYACENPSVLGMLLSMFRIGLFDHPVAAQPDAYHGDVSTPAHVALARTISEAGTVLLKNQGGVLPITGRGKTIAVIGQPAGPAGAENEYNGGGSGHVPEFGDIPVVSPEQGITQRAAGGGDAAVYADGTTTAAAVTAAKAASVAIVFAGDSDSEGIDRSDLTLTGGVCEFTSCTPEPYDQNALIAAVAAASPDTIVVLNAGGPVLMPWLSSIKGLFEAWYPGQEDGNAIAALLFGDVDPSGRLTETFPASPGDIPEQSPAQWPGVNQPGDTVGPHSQYSEGLLVGHRCDDAKRITPAFPAVTGEGATLKLILASAPPCGGWWVRTKTVSSGPAMKPSKEIV